LHDDAVREGTAGAGRPFFVPLRLSATDCGRGFGMLLEVMNHGANFSISAEPRKYRRVVFAFLLLLTPALGGFSQISAQIPAPSSLQPVTQPVNPQAGGAASTANSTGPSLQPRPGLNIVVLDPAHGGTDTGARGTGGIRESEIVLEFAMQVRRSLEAQGFQVIQTRLTNENPSFDDRSALANAQTGAVFVSLHVSSTGLPGTARVYVNSDLPAGRESNGLIPWDRAQAPFLGLSHKLGDMVQGNLAQKFRGSPGSAQTSAIRQLRTTAAPAIAVEISSVSVNDRGDLDRMAPGVADAIARGVTTFRPSYVVANMSGAFR
jgi:N-acetylmuramoyl-L-alanine amidase